MLARARRVEDVLHRLTTVLCVAVLGARQVGKTTLAGFVADAWNGPVLTSALVVPQLRPWHENIGKRQVRSPKVYLSDSGLLHALLDLPDRLTVDRHPSLGASWEGFVIEQLTTATRARPDQTYFWATHAGAELDPLIVRGTHRVGFENKRTVAPRMTRSLRSAIESLGLDRAYLVHAGSQTFPVAEGVVALAAADLADPPPELSEG